MKNEKLSIKNVGVIGMGGVGVSISWVLQQAGLNVIAFKKSKTEAERFKNAMNNGKISVINKTKIKTLNGNPNFKIKVTSSLQEIAEKCDLILYCSLFPQNVSSYHFTENQLEIINHRSVPILVFPGKLGSSWLIGKGKTKVGLVGYSPVFATKEVIESSEETFININSFKSSIPLAYDDKEERLSLLSFLNKCFNFSTEIPTFIDGGHSLKTSLCSPISTINASAICDNAEAIIQSKGTVIRKPIYALSEKYSLLFQEAFNEQLLLAKLLGFSNLSTITDWLQNRSQKVVLDNVTDMLHEIYQDKNVALDENDRRITESYYALLFFKSFAETLGIDVFATKQLLRKLSELHLKLDKTTSLQTTALCLQESAIAYAKNVLNTKELKEINKYSFYKNEISLNNV